MRHDADREFQALLDVIVDTLGLILLEVRESVEQLEAGVPEVVSLGVPFPKLSRELIEICLRCFVEVGHERYSAVFFGVIQVSKRAAQLQ